MSGPGQVAGVLGRGIISLGARFVLLATAAFVLMILDHDGEHMGPVRGLLSRVVYPIQVAVDLPFSTVQSLRHSMADRRALLEENERLERELRVASFQVQNLNALKRENDRLRELVNAIQSQPELDIRMADIMTVDMENRQRFVINRGANDGVYVNQPLLDADGVVGQVVAVSARWSEALLITDTSHRIHVANERNDQRMIAQGTGDSGSLRLWVSNEDDIRVGDLLVTTGYGGVFPQGRPVARVTVFERDPGQNFAKALAEPVSALDRNQEVLLVWDRQEGSDLPESTAAVMARLPR